MNNRLREYIDNLFATAPSNRKTVEVKEEILQNLTDKYNDLIAEGKNEDVAFNIAVELHEVKTEDAEDLADLEGVFDLTLTGLSLLILYFAALARVRQRAPSATNSWWYRASTAPSSGAVHAPRWSRC